eukprot:m.332076 g.332076  ORF g.332076 m.332076 type:complete len:77 (-) comp16870_c0_seq1:127-357(-)
MAGRVLLARSSAALNTMSARGMATAADPIKKLFLDHLKKASTQVFKDGASDKRAMDLYAKAKGAEFEKAYKAAAKK